MLGFNKPRSKAFSFITEVVGICIYMLWNYHKPVYTGCQQKIMRFHKDHFRGRRMKLLIKISSII